MPVVWNLDLDQTPEPADGEDHGPQFAMAFYPEGDTDTQVVMFCRLTWFAEGKGGERTLAPQCTITGARIAHLIPYAWALQSEFEPPDPAAY